MDFSNPTDHPSAIFPHPYMDERQKERLFYGEIPRVIIPEDQPVAAEPSKTLQSLRILAQHGISPTQLLGLLSDPALRAFFQIWEELQGDCGWQSLWDAIQILDLQTHDPISANQTPSSENPSSLQYTLDPRWSTLTGSTLRDSTIMVERSPMAMSVQPTTTQQPYHQPLAGYPSTRLDPPFAISASMNLNMSDIPDSDLKFALNSDDLIVPPVEDPADTMPRDSSVLSTSFDTAIDHNSLDGQANLHVDYQRFQSTAITPLQVPAPSRGTVRHRRRPSTGISAHRPLVPDKDFISYTPPVPPKPLWRSPCPYCNMDFISQKEFVAHMTAEHDRPTQYICLHPVPTREGCCFQTYRLSQSNRHHKREHAEDGNMTREDHRQAAPWRAERPSSRPKQVWGCWMCNHPSYTVESWVEHHLQQHRNCTRRQMKWEWLVRSLLSQDATSLLWENQIDQLEQLTGYRWKIEWSEAARDPVRDKLIHNLETKSFDSRSFASDPSACQSIVMAAMDATFDFKSMLEPMSANQKSIKRPSTSSPPDSNKVRPSGTCPLPRHQNFAGSKCYPVNVSTMPSQSASQPTSHPRVLIKRDVREKHRA